MNKFTILTKQEMQEVNGGMWWCYICPMRPGGKPHPPHPITIGDIFGIPSNKKTTLLRSFVTF